MLRTANQLLQVALQLLQQGQHVQGRRVESAKVGVDCVSVACQTDDVDEEPEDSVESEETAVSGASWGVAQLKALLQEEMDPRNDSPG